MVDVRIDSEKLNRMYEEIERLRAALCRADEGCNYVDLYVVDGE